MKQLTFPQVSANTSIVMGLMLCVAMATLTHRTQSVGHEGLLAPTAGQVTPSRSAEQDFTSRFETDFVGRPESISVAEPYVRYQLKSVYYFFKDGHLVLTSRTSNPSL